MTVLDIRQCHDALNSSQTGRVIARREVEVDFRTCALYAAAIGAERDVYLDDRTRDGVLAPPALVTALEWPLVSGPEFLAAIGLPQEQLFARLLHAFQDSRFHRPFRVGDRLALEATLASVTVTRNGALVVTRIQSSDARSGEPVAESWFGGHFRGVMVMHPRTVMEPPSITMPEATGQAASTELTISRGRSHIYDECARLRNPIHTDLSFATSTGLDDVALHGSLLWAIMGEQVIDRFGNGKPERLKRLAAKFKRPIFPNRTLTVELARATADMRQIAMILRDDERAGRLCEGIAEID